MMQSIIRFCRLSTQLLMATAAALALVVVAGTYAKADGDRDHGRSDERLPVYLDASVHPTGANDNCPSPQLWQGSGNPVTTFQRKRDVDAGVELALKTINRFGPDIRSTYVDEDGRVHIEVPSGEQ
jgi:hypothetical protein